MPSREASDSTTRHFVRVGCPKKCHRTAGWAGGGNRRDDAKDPDRLLSQRLRRGGTEDCSVDSRIRARKKHRVLEHRTRTCCFPRNVSHAYARSVTSATCDDDDDDDIQDDNKGAPSSRATHSAWQNATALNAAHCAPQEPAM